MNARGWSNPAVQPSSGAEWQLLPRREGGGVVGDPFSHDRLPRPHHEREVREKGGRGGEKKVGKKRWLQATRWEGGGCEGRGGGEGRLAVCMSGAVRWHQPPSIKEPLEGPRAAAAQEGGEEGMCAEETPLFLPSVPSALDQRPARIGSKLSGRMMQLKFSRSDSPRAITAARGPGWPGDVHADTVSQVKSRRGGGEECKRSAFSRFRGYRVN